MSREWNIKDFGAVGDGVFVNTNCINDAIKQCALNGGGKVVVPQGTFVTGSIEMQSNVCLYLEMGAELKSSGNPDDFPTNGFYHNEMGYVTSLIWAIDKENISICGDGKIDISSEITYKGYEKEFYLVDKSLLSPERLDEGIYPKNESRVNQPIFFENCTSLTVKDLKIVNSTCWTVVFSNCSDIHVKSLTINNDMCVQNDDGIHFSACRDAVVSDCNICCADDCIAMTCITHVDGINRNIVINNCNFCTRSAAVRIAHNLDGLCISNINVYNSNRGIGIFTHDNSTISNVNISNIRLQTALLAGAWWGKAEPLIISAAAKNSLIQNVSVSDISGIGENGIVIYGENHNVHNLSLSNIKFMVKKTDYFHTYCTGLDLRPYKEIEDHNGPYLLDIRGVGDISLNNVSIDFE